jgi:hypothetical protein
MLNMWCMWHLDEFITRKIIFYKLSFVTKNVIYYYYYNYKIIAIGTLNCKQQVVINIFSFHDYLIWLMWFDMTNYDFNVIFDDVIILKVFQNIKIFFELNY